jgi:hypothetical protein
VTVRKSAFALAAALCSAALLSACNLVTSTNRAVFFLFDVSGTYAKATPAAAKAASFLISEMQPGDWIGASQITSCSFSEKEILLQQQIPETPSRAAEVKRDLFAKLKTYSEQVKPTSYTDIHGALAQASFELRQRPESERVIVIFSDMVEDLAKNCDTSDVKLDLSGISVVASNVIKSDPADPEKYFKLLQDWETLVTQSGGKWSMASSPDQLPNLIAAR